MRNRTASGRAVVTALAVAGLFVADAGAAKPAPRISLSVASADQRALRESGRLRVSVRGPARARVTLGADALTDRGRRAIARRRTVRLRSRRRRSVTLSLNADGRRMATTCGDLEVSASARTRASRTRRARRIRRRAVLGGDPAGCYRMGLATRSINPGPDGKFAGQNVNLGGYGLGGPPGFPGRPATGILGDGAQVRAIVVSDGKTRFAIADMEVQGWFTATKDGPYGIVDMRKAIEARTGGALKAGAVVIQSDHTHGGPDPMGVWGGSPLAYRQFVMTQTVDAVVEALRREQAGTLVYGTAPGRDLQSNQFDYDASNAVMDSDLHVLQARDAGGRPFATFLEFSAHATVLGSGNTKVTGDWVTVANSLLEERFGGRAMTVVGTLGRTQPADRQCADTSVPEGDARNLCTLRQYAERVVSRAAQAQSAARPLPGAPVVAARSYLIQDVAHNVAILGLAYAGDPLGFPLNRSLSPPWLAGNVLGTVTASARIGDLLLSSIPGEAYPQIALKVRELVPARGHMTAGLANDQLGYLIAPYESYPEPIRRTAFNQRGDEVSPIDNDNYAFNVSHTLGERVTCSLLRGAGEVFGKGLEYRQAYDRCAAFPNDLLYEAGADIG
jgi:hypothetical protein